MKYINKKIIKSIAVFACAAGLLVSFASCTGITGNKKQEEKTQKSCTVSGSVLLEGQNAVSSVRSATTSFSIPKGAEYILLAYSATTDPKTGLTTFDPDSETHGTFDSDTMQYSIELLSAGTWSIELSIVNSGVSAAIAQKMINVDNDLTDLTNEDLVIMAGFNFSINGKAETDEIVTSPINLVISRDSSSTDISGIKWVWKEPNNVTQAPVKVANWFEKLTDDPENSNYEEYPKTITKNFVNNKVTFAFEAVPTWSYNVNLIIVKSNGDEYVFNEVINVFQNFTTDTWYGDSIHLTKNPSTGEYSFIVSDELLENLQKTQDNAEMTESNTPYVLYSDIGKEPIALRAEEGSDAKFYYDDSYNGITGVQVFNDIDEDEEITNPISYSSNFCFGNDRLYIMESELDDEVDEDDHYININKYKKSYSGFVKDGPGIDIIEKLAIPEGAENIQVGQIAYFNGFICFQWSYKKDSYIYKFAICNINSGEIISEEFTVRNIYSCIVVNAKKTNVDVQGEPNTKYEGKLYYIDKDGNYSPLSLKVASITLKTNIDEYNNETFDSVTLTQSSTPVFELSAENLTTSTVSEKEFGSISFGDMILQGNYLYALVNCYGGSVAVYKQRFDEQGQPVTDGEDDEFMYDSVSDLYTSTGGVLKFAVSDDGSLTRENWIIDGNETILLGLYTQTLTAEDNYYSKSYEGWNEVYNPYNGILALQPPLDSTDFYFYGPRKFIARKPDVLVIADDGVFIEDDSYESRALTAKNRVVTLNLNDLSLSAIDVKTTFSMTYYNATGLEIRIP